MKHLFILFIAFVSCSFNNSSVAQSNLKVVIIRHAEKPEDGDNLSCAGFNRALKLPAVIVSKFGKPNYLYVPAPTEGKVTKSLRMMQTVSPLAVKCNLPVNTNYEVSQTNKLANNILKRSGTVVVVWEHGSIPDIVAALGVKYKDLKWSGSDYDSIWEVTIAGNKRTLVKTAEGIRPGSACGF